ncbi:hypothetical protein I317_00484 [Kwoniella heveanensis CBS 569]|nr:hypothetical protein I317_00484 [Kwoniella heveanensis CBS 569]
MLPLTVPLHRGIGFLAPHGVLDIAKSFSASPSSTSSQSTTLSRSFSPSPTASFASTSSADPASGSSSSTSSSTSSSPMTTTDVQDEDTSSGGTTKWAPIIGGLVGGVALVVLLFLFWRWYITRHSPSSSSSKKNKKKRIPYPYPSIEGGGGAPGPGGKSFLDMVAESNSSLVERDKARDMELKRRTAELMSDPSAFAEPRTAPPVPFGTSSRSAMGLTPLSSQRTEFSPTVIAKNKNAQIRKKGKSKDAEDLRGYTITTQRLAERPVSLTSTDIALATASKNRVHNALAPHPIPPSKAYLNDPRGTADSIDFSAPPSGSRRSSALSGLSGRSESSMSGGILSPQDFKGDENASRGKAKPTKSTKTRLSAIPPAAARKYFSSRLSVKNSGQSQGQGSGQNQIPSMDFSVAPATPESVHTGHDNGNVASISRDISTRSTNTAGHGRAGNRDSENTLPSLYEPQTGALTYRASGNTMFSADMSDYNAHYPGTQTLYGRITGAGGAGGRDSFGVFGGDEGNGAGSSEVIGAALGSGKKGRESLWDRPWDGGADDDSDISPKTKK